ncbi:hypothetical protein BDY21DRAFT_343968 [Lineolata rhizophorae]|uniref:Membrane-associated, eicosanoid/glutathione metabolism protein n=1 Tax=Lineolata rhizophorae TaxID=578093 RepID=A0A6A6P204_9PEZI|nr:hypothetical protein BDY21DRAFT_343968 [Lineolata rhizophorae]
MASLPQYNYSFFGIPVSYGVAMLPRLYSMLMIKRAANNRWNNVNPRGVDTVEKIKQRVPPDVFARYERTVAAHQNGLESFPLVTTAIILGNWAQLPAAELNTFVAGYIASRIVYCLLYINTTRGKLSFIRSGTFIAGMLWCTYTIVKSCSILSG